MAELPNIKPFVDTIPTLDNNVTPSVSTEIHPELPSIVQDIRDNTYTPQSSAGSNPLTAGLNSNRRKRNSLDELASGGTSQSIFRNDGFRLVDAYDELSDGSFVSKFDNYLQNSDNEQRFAQDQSTTTKWMNGLGKFATKTGTAIAGGTIGTAYGLGEAMFTGDWTAIYENDFTNIVDDFDKKMNRNLPNYYTKQERDAGFIDSLGSANFWANDFMGGLSFTVGAIASEGLWAAATGGASLAVSAGKYGLKAARTLGKIKKSKQIANKLTNFASKGVDEAKKSAIAYGRLGAAANTTRALYTSAGYEASIEARHFEAEQRDMFNSHFDAKGVAPTQEEITAFEKEIGGQVNTVFGVNMGLVGASNVLMLGQIYNIKNPLKAASKSVEKSIFGNGTELVGGIRKPIQRNIAQRVAGVSYNLFKNPVREGVFEEGLQSVTSKAGGNIVESMYNIDKDTLSYMESFYEGMADTYGTKEGWKEVGLGMLIGAFSGGGINLMNKKNPFSATIDASKKQSSLAVEQVKAMEESGGANAIYSTYTEVQNKLAEDIVRTNNMMNSAKKIEEAGRTGDLALAERARNETFNAQMVYASNLDMADELQEDFFLKLDNVPNADFAKNFNINLNEVGGKRNELKQEYIGKREKFESNKEFANYLIGNISKKEIKAIEEKNGIKNINTELLRSTLAYELSMQEGYIESATNFNDAIVNVLGQFNEDNFSLRSAANVKIALDKAPNALKKEFIVNQKDIRVHQREVDKVEKRRRTASEITSNDPKVTEKTRKELVKLNKISDELKEKGRDLINSRRLTIEAIEVASNTPLATEAILLEGDSNTLLTALDKIDRQINNLKTSDPKTFAKIQAYSKGYKKSLESAKRATSILESFYESDIQLNGASRTFLNKVAEYNNPTEKVVKQLVDSYKGFQDLVVERDIKKATQNLIDETNAKYDAEIAALETPKTNEAEINKRREEELAKIKNTANNADAVVNNTANNTISPIQKIENEIERLLSQEGALRNINSIQDIDGTTPTQQEIDRYNTLLDKIRANKKSSTILLSRYRGQRRKLSKEEVKRSGLTATEAQEFQDLSDKLSDFAIASIYGDQADVTIKDLLDQRSALKEESDSQIIENTPTAEELVDAVESSFQKGQSNESNRYVLSPDTVMARLNSEDGTYTVSHFVGENREELETKLREAGVPYNIEDNNTIKLATEENFNAFLEVFDMKPFSYEGNSNYWLSISKKNKDGNYVPADGNFTIQTIGEQAVNMFFPQELYNMKKGDEVRFVYNPNDRYNQKLLRSNLSNKEFSQQAAIYITDSKGKVLGVLKKGDDSQDNAKINRVREDFAKNYKDSTEWATLPFKTTVKKIFTNQPNIEISPEGNLVYKDIDAKYFEENEGLNYKIKGFGMYSDSTITLNDNFSFSTEEVQTSYLGSKSKATPIIIVEQGNQLIAYPVRSKVANKNYTAEFDAIYNSRDSKVDRIKQLQQFAISLGIDPKTYNIYYINDQESFLDSSEFEASRQAFREEIEKRSSFFTIEDILSKEVTKEVFAQRVETTLDFSNPPFRSPKIEIYENIIATDNAPLEAIEQKAISMDEVAEKVPTNITTEKQIEEFVESQNEATQNAYNNDQDYKQALISTVRQTKTIPVFKDGNETYQDLQETVDVDVVSKANIENLGNSLTNDPVNNAVAFKIFAETLGVVIPLDVSLLNSEQADFFNLKINEFLQSPSTSTTRELSNAIDSLTITEKAKKVVIEDSTEGLVYYDSKLTEQEVFDTHGLIRTGKENIYKRVNKDSLETLYGRTDIDSTNINEFSKSSSLSEELVLHKLTNGYTVDTLIRHRKTELTKLKAEKLKKNFAHEFATKINKEKKLGSVAYRNFYSNFKVDRKGVRLKEGVDMESLPQEFVEKNLIEYSLISKHVNFNFPQNESTTQSVEDKILDAVNNPSIIPSPNAEVFSTDIETEVVTKTEADFLKINKDIYQRVFTDKVSNNAIFKKVKHNANRDFFATFVERGTTDKPMSYLKTFDQTVEVTDAIEIDSYLSGKQLKKAEDKNFDCK